MFVAGNQSIVLQDPVNVYHYCSLFVNLVLISVRSRQNPVTAASHHDSGITNCTHHGLRVLRLACIVEDIL